ncbi:acyl-CoA dehydrogenase family protein [Verminephrobacter aporrectodeae]|uniref:Acyl-CoA dehydrogenase n=1 Tax=Verminephrobacter aporrectodeae subsp. tuberculatae TaxID=1110392 RepID=A0ABT3KWE1_9BURK|nr:acyl-CoA dehydrogenase family protein [Verminephrobacter aporrectodeae]MCW5322668.1 acyl-CoA dehydrogenase [Verminephrobacter aporrectodeae subsp. tuberculatae]MCW8163617.1 acyl-CoA dehydrogenase [Verminephrobacter aporrectodeae subsp. tuberculatae]MCW8169005.1 acyl-CoA dehydrogenase [Verminephrobacter aporrectodeae subsp. tuberculatae]MCW8176974.1 acyl-CoA dehydrogenase [Verminephrobacter aporrectodeae subsp. tuberculatae]MCW8202541.1 acyl-CoA dehydrogenase [Verminephrobacter aporrectodeae
MQRAPQAFEQFLGSLRNYVRERLVPNETRVAEADEVPADLVADMAAQGLFGYSIPEAYGGAGMTTEELVLAAMELSQCAVAFRARVGTNTGIGSEALVTDGTEAQKRRYLPRLASGELTGAFALTEPEAGSDAASLRTLARRDGDHYVLNGTKCFITNAPIADLFTVLARTDPDDLSARGVTAFLVERGMPGLSTGPAYGKMGQAGSPVSEVHMADCIVPAENVIGGREGQGFKTAMRVLNKQRIHLAALCIGPAIRMLQDAVAFVATRKQFGQTLSSFQLVQAMIADSQTEVHAARALVLDTARKRDEGIDVTMEASICKYFASEMCGRVADRSVQMLGGYGYIADHGMERFYRDVRLFRLYEGTSQIHQLNIAKRTLAQAGYGG